MSTGGIRSASILRGVTIIILLVGLLGVISLVSVIFLQPQDGGSPGSGSAEYFTDTVTEIVDGDTLYVGGIKIRLALVDTPEYYEAGYEEATQFVENLCPVGSQATVDQDDWQLYDSYGRMLAVVYCEGKNLNRELLENGHAVILTQYCDDSEFQNQSWARDYGC